MEQTELLHQVATLLVIGWTVIAAVIYVVYCLSLQAIADKLDYPASWLSWVPYLQFLVPHLLCGQKWYIFVFAFFLAPISSMGFAFLGIWPLSLFFFLVPLGYLFFLYGGIAYRRQLPIWLGILSLLPPFGIFAFLYIAFHDGFGFKPFWPGVAIWTLLGLYPILELDFSKPIDQTTQTQTLVADILSGKVDPKDLESQLQAIAQKQGMATATNSTTADGQIVEDLKATIASQFGGKDAPTQDGPDPRRETYAEKSCPPSLEEKGARPHLGFESWCVIPSKPEVRHGDYWKWHPDGSLSSFGAFAHGKREGTWLKWHSNGFLAAEMI